MEGTAMKHRIKMIVFLLVIALILLMLCACEDIGSDPPVVTTEVIDTTTPLYDPTASPIELTWEEESEILRNFVFRSTSNLSEENYKVRCFGAEDGAYAVFVETVGYVPIEFEDYLEKPYSTPMTREHFEDSSFDFWYEIGNPLIIYKDGKFYSLSEALGSGIVTRTFLKEVNDRYKAVNPGFYDNNYNYGYGY